MNNRNSNILMYLFSAIAGAFFIGCFLSSCGKGSGILPAGSNIQYQVVNLSPDITPVDLYINFVKRNTSVSFFYPNPSGYFSLTTIDTPFQIRRSIDPGVSVFSLDTVLKNNVRYTLFVTGYFANRSIIPILTVDTSALPTVGRGKVRFVNTSPGSGGLDVSANGTIAFTNAIYPSVSKFKELPAGNYDFKVFATGSTNPIFDFPGVTVQDGKIYTMYTRGIVGRIDSAAFGLGVINNN